MSRFISFVVGLYTGIYATQHYEIPKLPGPIGLWENIKDFAKNFEKKDKNR